MQSPVLVANLANKVDITKHVIIATVINVIIGILNNVS